MKGEGRKKRRGGREERREGREREKERKRTREKERAENPRSDLCGWDIVSKRLSYIRRNRKGQPRLCKEFNILFLVEWETPERFQKGNHMS